jgi:hypothetical protein
MMEAMIRHEKDLARVVAKDPTAYKDISLAYLTAYSLYWLHKWELRRTIEAIAVLNWRLFPTKFAMVGFQEYPDAFRTNRSLLQGQPKYRNLLTGAASKGFSLNERGLAVARDLTKQLGVPTTAEGTELGVEPAAEAPNKVSNRARSLEPERAMQNVRGSKLYEKWKSGVMGERDLIHVHALLGIFDHTPSKIRQKAMKDLESNAADCKDTEIMRFLTDVRQIFPMVFL